MSDTKRHKSNEWPDKMSADELKAEGNKLFAAKDFTGAVEKFSEAIEVDP